MKKAAKSIALCLACCLAFSVSTFAHGGRTDGNGGHKDNKNVSGLGSYHYHHGYGPHLHPDGVCPYDAPKPEPQPKPAPKPMNQTSTTDIHSYVNNQFVPSLNYKDATYVIARDLEDCGYTVDWDSNDRTLTLSFSGKDGAATTSVNNTTIYTVEDTDIKAYVVHPETKEKKEISAYNIGGRTIVRFSELGNTRWEKESRACYLTT